jgi:hypothetical protein
LSFKLIFNKCHEHPEEYCSIDCEDCAEKYCCYCFLENHGGHKASYLYKLNNYEKAELESLKSDVELILWQLLASKMKMKGVKTFDVTHVEADIKRYFSDMHAKLHLAERNLKKKLSSMESEDVDLDDINFTLKSEINRVKQILNHFDLLNSKKLNVRALYEEAQALRDTPCQLVSDQKSLQPVEFVVEEDFDNLEERLSLKKLPTMEYALQPIEDWNSAGGKRELEILKRESEARNQSVLSPECSCFSPPRTVVQVAEKVEPVKSRTSEDGKIRVLVTHVNGLDSFYVQKYSSLTHIQAMTASIDSKKKQLINHEDLRIGRIYGVLYETKNLSQWRRGKLIDYAPKGPNEFLYKVFFIDYGNTLNAITRNKIRELPIRISRRPPFAFECKLSNLAGIRFAPQAHLHLPQVIGEKETYLQYTDSNKNEKNKIREVDLFVPSSNGSLFSVKDMLMNDPVASPEVNGYISYLQLKYFQNSKKFVVGQDVEVMVTHVRDPFYICVQLVENLKFIQKMRNELTKYYDDKPAMSCVPVEGTDVIAKYEHNVQGKWHRATVTSVNVVNKQVDVYFIDWGYSTVLPWSSIKLLSENFIRMECQGIILKLADVQNVNPTLPWSQQTIEYLRGELASEKQCRMIVSSVQPLEGALFKYRPAADICVNALLVERDHALSTGNLSQTVFWPNQLDEQFEEDEDLAFQMVKKSEEIIMESENDDFTLGVKLQVIVADCQSPDLIFVKFKKYEEIEKQLHDELQVYYQETRQHKSGKWKVGESCVVYDSATQSYLRGVVEDIIDADNYSVHLYDQVRELEVHKRAMFIQNKFFNEYASYVCKCRLANIKPAGDAGKWSNLAVEMLQKIFATYGNIYMKKIETNEDDKMIGVEMWYSTTVPAKALQPSKVKYISINRALLEAGVAFSVSGNKASKDREVHVVKNDLDLSSTEEFYPAEQNQQELVSDEELSPAENPQELVPDEEFHKTPLKCWPKPYALQKMEFNAVLTCVDNEGCFSVRDEEMNPVYLQLEENVTSKLNSLTLDTNLGEWRINDMCTIWFEGRWYRGVVLEIGETELSVEMIDFGSEHVVNKKDVTKCIMFPDLPPFVNKIQLYDVWSLSGRWTARDVNDLLEIVTANVKVVIKGDLDQKVPYAEVYLEDGTSVNDLITEKCPHMFRRGKNCVTKILSKTAAS